MTRNRAVLIGIFLALAASSVYLLRATSGPHPMQFTVLSETELAATLSWEQCVPSPQIQDKAQRVAAKTLEKALWGQDAEQCFATGENSELSNHIDRLGSSSPEHPRPALNPSCSKLIANVEQATGPERGCSMWSDTLVPFDQNTDWQPLSRAALTFGLHAWRLAQGHQSEAAINTLLTCVRFGHDLARGRVDQMRNAFSVAVSKICFETAQNILNSPLISVDEVTAWIEELAEIRRTLPHPGRTFAATHKILSKELEQTDSGAEVAPRLLEQTLEAVLVQNQRACIGVSPIACFKLLHKFTEARTKEVADKSLGPKQRALSLAAKQASKGNKLAVRIALDQVRSLTSLQVHLHFRRYLKEYGRCPDVTVFSKAPFAGLMKSQDGWASLQAHVVESGFGLAPAQYAEVETNFNKWHLECNEDIWRRKLKPYEPQLDPVNQAWQERLNAEIDKLDELHYSISRELLEVVSSAERPQVLPDFWPRDGAIDLQKVTSMSLAARLGFESNDLVHSINGFRIASVPDGSLVTAADLQALEKLLIVVTRAQQSFVLRIDIQ